MRKSLIGMALILATPSAFSSACVDIKDASARLSCFETAASCAELSSDAKRLACYDETYKSAAEHSATASSALTIPVPEAGNTNGVADTPVTVASDQNEKSAKAPLDSQVADQDFGKRKRADEPKQYIEATIIGTQLDPRRIDYLRLDNGHVWREYEDYRVKYSVGQKVRIEEGLLGSYDMKIDGVKKLIKVKRIN